MIGSIAVYRVAFPMTDFNLSASSDFSDRSSIRGKFLDTLIGVTLLSLMAVAQIAWLIFLGWVAYRCIR